MQKPGITEYYHSVYGGLCSLNIERLYSTYIYMYIHSGVMKLDNFVCVFCGVSEMLRKQYQSSSCFREDQQLEVLFKGLYN